MRTCAPLVLLGLCPKLKYPPAMRGGSLFAILLFSIFPGLSCPTKLAGDIAQLSASCGRCSETENGQEQGELRTTVSKAAQ